MLAKRYNIMVEYVPLSGDWDILENADFNLVVTFHRIFQNKHLNSAKTNINIHPSLLPKYKGKNPFVEMLRSKEKKIGITAHEMDTGIDTGNILFQKSYKVSDIFIDQSHIRRFYHRKMEDFLLDFHNYLKARS
jgi:methionyl-tRNA formyltransferase